MAGGRHRPWRPLKYVTTTVGQFSAALDILVPIIHGHCLEDNCAGDEIRAHADNISRMSVFHSSARAVREVMRCFESEPSADGRLPSVQQKSSGLKFSKSRTGSHVTYSCHHNSSRFSFPIFVNSLRFSVFHSLQTITPRIY
jgi:hypothetical protein